MPTAPVLPAREALDAALRQIESKAPDFGPLGLSNHAPMVVEALSELGRPDAIAPWLNKYLPQLSDLPARPETPAERVSEPDASAWGDRSRYAEWQTWFEQELSGSKPNTVLDRWVARLAPGVFTQLGHGLLRTAHAARAVAREPSPPRTAELAQGLATWASSYRAMSWADNTAATSSAAHSTASAALAAVPRLALSTTEGSPQELLLNASSRPEFSEVPSLLKLGAEPSAFVTDLVTAMANLYSATIDNEDASKPLMDIAFVHAITATSAVRLLLPYVSAATIEALLQPIWIFNAAICSVFSGVPAGPNAIPDTPEPEPGVGEVGGRFAELIDEAIIGADEHGIKFTEVCVREIRAGAPRDLLVLSRLVVARLVMVELKRERAEKLARKKARKN